MLCQKTPTTIGHTTIWVMLCTSRVRLVILCAVVIILSIWTYQRNIVWQNNTNFWSDVVSKTPHNYRAHNNLGNALYKQGRTAEAIEHYLQALRIKPDFEEAHNSLAIALFRKGNIEGAIAHFRKALRINPGYVDAKNNLKKALMMQQQKQ